MTFRSVLLVLASLLFLTAASEAQPLVNPYYFAMPDSLDVDTSLVVPTAETFERAGERGRIRVKDGHFVDPDGMRFRIVGTTVRLRACFPDSATAIRMAKRFRALGINTVQFMQLDYNWWQPSSILVVGSSTLGGGLHPENTKRFDWFVHQLKEHGIYSGIILHSAWRPRPEDGVRQWDSTGWGARTPIFFDPQVQQIHRDIVRLLLEHENPYTGTTYKDEPALLYLMPWEDPSLTVYWLYTREVCRDNYTGSANVGSEHLALMDSLYQEFLIEKGYTIDAQLNTSWRSWAENPDEQVRNGDFEDPFDQAAWLFTTNAASGAQAIMQYSESDPASGSFSGRILIGDPGTSRAHVILRQTLTEAKNRRMYRLTMKMRTTPEAGSRGIQIYAYNSAYPYEGILNQTFQISDTWQEYTFDFVAKTSNDDSPIMQIRMGRDQGDVYIDDVSFKEVTIDGLRAGESIESRSVRRLPFVDYTISEKRAKEQGEFYLQHQEQLFEDLRMLVRDTLQSEILLAPGRRIYDARDRYAARNYDFFSYYEFRSSTVPFTGEANGGLSWAHSAQDLDTKPYVISGLNYYFPRQHQTEGNLIIPAYAGMQDWDGLHFSYFAAVPTSGRMRSDSATYWEFYDKPHMLTLLPAISNMIRRSDVDKTEKVVSIINNQESIDYPQHHSNAAYSLQNSADGRMGLFRRVEVASEMGEEESFLPQLEISQLTGDIDPSAYDGENGQIFFDATLDLYRLITPRTMAVAGNMEGQIVAEQDFIVEQVSTGAHSTVILSSLTDSAIVASERNLLVIGSRGLNEGAEFNEANTNLTLWGSGPMQLEGRTMRVTVRAPEWDSCHVTPLGPDARPMMDKRRMIERSPTGRFSIAVETNVDESPWYLVEFSNIPTSVEEGGVAPVVGVAPNPVFDGSFTVRHVSAALQIEVVDMTGAVVRSQSATGEATRVPTRGLASGVYTVMIDGGRRGTTSVIIH